jgi:hypothetical protein
VRDVRIAAPDGRKSTTAEESGVTWSIVESASRRLLRWAAAKQGHDPERWPWGTRRSS